MTRRKRTGQAITIPCSPSARRYIGDCCQIGYRHDNIRMTGRIPCRRNPWQERNAHVCLVEGAISLAILSDGQFCSPHICKAACIQAFCTIGDITSRSLAARATPCLSWRAAIAAPCFRRDAIWFSASLLAICGTQFQHGRLQAVLLFHIVRRMAGSAACR